MGIFEQQAIALASVRTVSEKPRKRRSVTCYCEAYTFPHRMHSGECNGYQSKKQTGYTSLETLEKMSGMTAKDFK